MLDLVRSACASQPAVDSAVSLAKRAIEIAYDLAQAAHVGDITDNPLGRRVVEARMLITGGVENSKHGAPQISRTLHWRNALKAISEDLPTFESATDRASVARHTALRLEFQVGRRPSAERVEAVFRTFRQTAKPEKGCSSRAAEVRLLFKELGVPSSDETDFSTQLSRVADRRRY
jgi:hypothetical protein